MSLVTVISYVLYVSSQSEQGLTYFCEREEYGRANEVTCCAWVVDVFAWGLLLSTVAFSCLYIYGFVFVGWGQFAVPFSSIILNVMYMSGQMLVKDTQLEVAIEETRIAMSYTELKEKQREAITAFVRGRDTIVLLPTGYGKSIIFSMLPLVFDKLKGWFHVISIKVIVIIKGRGSTCLFL